MKYQVYEILNGEVRYIYEGMRGRRFSRNRATTFTTEEVKKLVSTCTHHNLVIAKEGSSLFRSTDEDGFIIDKERKLA